LAWRGFGTRLVPPVAEVRANHVAFCNLARGPPAGSHPALRRPVDRSDLTAFFRAPRLPSIGSSPRRLALKAGRREAGEAGHIDGAPPEIVLISRAQTT